MRPIALIMGDSHFRDDHPVARTDNYLNAQFQKFEWILNQAIRHQVPVIHSGDFLNKSRVSPLLESALINSLSIEVDFLSVPGNHEMPQHNIDLLVKSSLNVLYTSHSLQVLTTVDPPEDMGDFTLYGCEWGGTPRKKEDHVSPHVLLWHVMTYVGDLPFPGCKDLPADDLLDKYPDYDVIITGHNHKTFTVQSGGRVLINPGSMTRMAADQMDHKPVVFLLYDDLSFEEIPIPIKENVLTREHLDRKKERNERMESYVEAMGRAAEKGISFEENVMNHIAANELRPGVKEKLLLALED